jgi:hypothetical protein
MSPKQWLLITAVVILNIIVFGALIGMQQADQRSTPTPTWTPPPTFTALPRPTATAILMPTLPPGTRQPVFGATVDLTPTPPPQPDAPGA